MIFYKITFGTCKKEHRSEAGEEAELFLALSCEGGHISRAWHTMWLNGVMTAYVSGTGPQAYQKRFFTQEARECLKSLVNYFGQEPQWECVVDDSYHPRDYTWKNAPFLCLCTRPFDEESVVMRGDTARPVPHYRLPLSDEDRRNIRYWQAKYQCHCEVWCESGALEFPAYRQLADPRSELAEMGREVCRTIEAATGIPTYYYLLRFYGRKEAEERARRCPLCGGPWATPFADGRHPFHEFPFRCDSCRLVSDLDVWHVNARYAKIGEPPVKK